MVSAFRKCSDVTNILDGCLHRLFHTGVFVRKPFQLEITGINNKLGIIFLERSNLNHSQCNITLMLVSYRS